MRTSLLAVDTRSGSHRTASEAGVKQSALLVTQHNATAIDLRK
jgi:hypothetical protein